MFIRLKSNDSNDLNVNVNQIISFLPNPDGEGSIVIVAGNVPLVVQDSTRSIRGYVKKALATAEQSEG